MEENLIQLEKGKTDLEFEKEKLQRKIAELKHAVSELMDAPRQLIQVQFELEQIQTLQKEMKRLKEAAVPEYRQKTVQAEECAAAFAQARKRFDEAEGRRKAAERMMENFRAGLLAKDLKEGQKCPVCGSLHHPEPAVRSEEDGTEEELKALKETEENLRRVKERKFSQAEKANSELQSTLAHLQNDLAVCLKKQALDLDCDAKPVDELLVLLQTSFQAVDKLKAQKDGRYRELACRQTRLRQSEENLELAAGRQTEQLEEKRRHLDEQLRQAQMEREQRQERKQNLEGLSYPDWKTALMKQKEADQQVQAIEQAIQKARSSLQATAQSLNAKEGAVHSKTDLHQRQTLEAETLNRQISKLIASSVFADAKEMLEFCTDEAHIEKSEKIIADYHAKVLSNSEQLAAAQKDAEGRTVMDVTALEAEREECQSRLDKIRSEEYEVKSRMAVNEDLKTKIAAQQEAYEQSKKEHALTRRLSDLVRGQTGNGKITLEQYVQASGFDSIIDSANKRLKPMSDSQYVLHRKQDALGKRSNTFLDLEVEDLYSGTRRPVSNLSGGESFKASLSLALGLSDTISSNLGGIQMDALFVDEGFGTLDRKSIESAMDTLVTLSGNNKLVGIISHREELKDNIPQQIKVTKTSE